MVALNLAVGLAATSFLASAVSPARTPRPRSDQPAGLPEFAGHRKQVGRVPPRHFLPVREVHYVAHRNDLDPLRLLNRLEDFIRDAGQEDGSPQQVVDDMCPGNTFLTAERFDQAARKFKPEALWRGVALMTSVLAQMNLSDSTQPEILDAIRQRYGALCTIQGRTADCDHVRAVAPFDGAMTPQETVWTLVAISAFLHEVGPRVYACGLGPIWLRSSHPLFNGSDPEAGRGCTSTTLEVPSTVDERLHALAAIYLASPLDAAAYMKSAVHELVHAFTTTMLFPGLVQTFGGNLGVATAILECSTEKIANGATGDRCDSPDERQGCAKLMDHVDMRLSNVDRLTKGAVETGRKALHGAVIHQEWRAEAAVASAFVGIVGRPSSRTRLFERMQALPDAVVHDGRGLRTLPACTPDILLDEPLTVLPWTAAEDVAPPAAPQVEAGGDGAGRPWPMTVAHALGGLGGLAVVAAVARWLLRPVGVPQRWWRAQQGVLHVQEVFDAVAALDRPPSRRALQDALLHIPRDRLAQATDALVAHGLLRADLSVPEDVAAFRATLPVLETAGGDDLPDRHPAPA